MKKINWGSWNLWRATRLVLGLVFIGAGFYESDWILGAAGAFLLVHAYVNACAACQTGDCEIPQQRSNG
jgi:hypothetical protein